MALFAYLVSLVFAVWYFGSVTPEQVIAIAVQALLLALNEIKNAIKEKK